MLAAALRNAPKCLLLLTLAVSATAYGQDKKPTYPAMAPFEQYRMADRDAEIALARTAAPPSISADADVLVLGKTGYETAAKGTNGFVCFVERSWTAGLEDREFWNSTLRAPNCFNPQAARSVLPQYLARAQWAAAGATREQIIERYEASTGRDLSRIVFYETFARFKVAVVIQQIYFRYVRGQTQDERFRNFDALVRELIQEALTLAEQSRI